ncbi:MAG TPA: efflux RND transporter periplasmic adaptor subunit, partial [Chitinophagaceae bacterium]|nr:efflux RND transporter periplasmic adaptor subunit [Chitinophagaceae bacterium]
LKHGETGKIQMLVPLHHALLIPQKATYEIQDKRYVFVVDAQHVVHSRNITIKGEMPDLYVVDQGLKEGEEFVLEGVQRVKDDDKISYTIQDPREVVNHLRLRAE